MALAEGRRTMNRARREERRRKCAFPDRGSSPTTTPLRSTAPYATASMIPPSPPHTTVATRWCGQRTEVPCAVR
jgi:hypothetical protein